MARYIQGTYKPQNPYKYIGEGSPIYRSSWERKMFIWLDKHPNILEWASEPIKIPYFNPIKGSPANYIPDILIKYLDASGKTNVELVEIKPLNQTVSEHAKRTRDQVQQKLNEYKWAAARQFCSQNGIGFRVVTENELFGPKKARNKPRKK